MEHKVISGSGICAAVGKEISLPITPQVLFAATSFEEFPQFCGSLTVPGRIARGVIHQVGRHPLTTEVVRGAAVGNLNYFPEDIRVIVIFKS